MKNETQTRNIYTVDELTPEAFERAHEEYCNSLQEIPWQAETIDSLKAVIKSAGLKLGDWSIGAYNRGNYLKVSGLSDESGKFTGKRAMAWIENNLFQHLRDKNGKIKDCPLTGYHLDEYFLEDLRKSIKEGRTIRESFEDLADSAMRELENEDEYQRTEEYFRETADANGYEYTENGEII